MHIISFPLSYGLVPVFWDWQSNIGNHVTTKETEIMKLQIRNTHNYLLAVDNLVYAFVPFK